jgi:hypothetical protein
MKSFENLNYVNKKLEGDDALLLCILLFGCPQLEALYEISWIEDALRGLL